MKAAKIILVSCIGVSLGLFGSCADDLVDNGNDQGDKGTAVRFNIKDIQDVAQATTDAATTTGMPITHNAFEQTLNVQGLKTKDLVSQKLTVSGGQGGTCIIETTTAGVEADGPTHKKQGTRANISEKITEHFTTIGYRGTTAEGINGTPWFYNYDTNENGTLVKPVLWSWQQRFGKFYCVSPQATSENAKLKISPSNYTGTPYVDFEAETDVTKQKDLMTACSGVVEYKIRNSAPTVNLTFRHALTAVCFKVGSNLSYNKTITKVEIINAKSKGRYTLGTDATGTGAAWTELSAPATFTLGGDGTLNVKTAVDVNQVIMGNKGDNYTFYMIPQPLAGVSVKIYFDGEATPLVFKLKGNWKAGTTKTYALNENTSTWQYQLEVKNPKQSAAYNEIYAPSYDFFYSVKSYREMKDAEGKPVQQPVPWKVVGYDSNGDDKYSMDEKPEWLIGGKDGYKTSGKGGTNFEKVWPYVKEDLEDRLKERNEALKNAPVQGSAGSPYNLANATGAATVQNTANSYVISAPGTYRIPLVYGNAIHTTKASPNVGVTNEGAYKRTTPPTNNTPSTYENNVLLNFKDHDGKDITDPWITKSNNGANAPDGAKLVWADVYGIVTNLAVSGTGDNAFVTFTVPKEAIENGNAVIAVTKNGTVVWSWHLWFAPKSALKTIACTNYQNHVYNFTSETLGWKYTEWKATPYLQKRSVKVMIQQTAGNAGKKQYGIVTLVQEAYAWMKGYATLYQFGRKDAFPGTDGVADGRCIENGKDASFAATIQHPEVLYTDNESGKEDFSYCNLWSMNNDYHKAYMDGTFYKDETLWNDNPIVKTVYDPCPAGFHMPSTNAFTGFCKNGKRGADPSETEFYDWPILASPSSAPKYYTEGECGNGYYGWEFYNRLNDPNATILFLYMNLREVKKEWGQKSVGIVNQTDLAYFWTAIPYSSDKGYAVWIQHSAQDIINTHTTNDVFEGNGIRPVSDTPHN